VIIHREEIAGHQVRDFGPVARVLRHAQHERG
jgi:hypothetical protein